MKKPVGRLLYPNTGWYFAAMLLFTAAAAAVEQYILAGGALGAHRPERRRPVERGRAPIL